MEQKTEREERGRRGGCATRNLNSSCETAYGSQQEVWRWEMMTVSVSVEWGERGEDAEILSSWSGHGELEMRSSTEEMMRG
jgi:hypothetical protein